MTRNFWTVIAALGFMASIACGQWAGVVGWIVVGGLSTQLPAAE